MVLGPSCQLVNPFVVLLGFFLGCRSIRWPCLFLFPLTRARSLRLALGQSLVLAELADEDLGAALARVVFHAGLEARADADGEVAAVGGEGEGGDAVGELLVDLHAALGVGVPEGDGGVAAAAGEGAVGGVEGEGVDGVDDVGGGAVGGGGLALAVALEGVLAGLGLGRGVEELDGHAALDAARSVAGVGRHGGHGAREELERGLALLPGRRGRLRRQARGEGRQVVDVDQAGRHGDHELRGARGHGVGLAGEGDLEGRLGRVGGVVHVECAVPGGGDDEGFWGERLGLSACLAIIIAVVGGDGDGDGECQCFVYSQCWRLYTTLRTGAECLLSAVCSPLARSSLQTCQSMPALKASSSFAPKHTSSTGARCSIVRINEPCGPWPSAAAAAACMSYR